MPKRSKSTGLKISQAINAAIEGESKPLVYVPPNRRTQTSVMPTKVKEVRQHLVRIEHEADPIGFLISALHGALFDVQMVTDNGKVLCIQEQVSLKDRVKIAMFLANKQLPNVTLTRVSMDAPITGVSPGDNNANGMTFAQMVSKAAHNNEQPRKVTIIDQEDEDVGTVHQGADVLEK